MISMVFLNFEDITLTNMYLVIKNLEHSLTLYRQLHVKRIHIYICTGTVGVQSIRTLVIGK